MKLAYLRRLILDQIGLQAGKEVIVKVEPIQHVATERFKKLTVGDRKCLLENENPVSQQSSWIGYLILLTYPPGSTIIVQAVQ